MNAQEAREEIQKAFIAAGIFAVSTIALDNQKFTKPSDDTPWARLTINFTAGRQHTLGKPTNRKFEKKGFVFVQVFTVAGGATNINDGLVQQSLNVFEGVVLNGVHFTDGQIRTVGTLDKWYQQNAVLEFTYYEIK